ncbi:MAG: Acyl-homoserine lactone acylase QuiP precursor [Planctomycetota bacterium]
MLERVTLKRLGNGVPIAAICNENRWDREEFDRRWRNELERRSPKCDGSVLAAVDSEVNIDRDRWGIPHIRGTSCRDLWFGFGYAMAQDRLFQLDYLRRKGMGRLSEILGREGLSLDLIARTVGLNRIAQAELAKLPPETRERLDDFARGINAWIAQCGDLLPIEFDLLDYRLEPWSALDSVAIENEFRWYLTGRFPVIVMPELAKRTLGEGPLYRDFLLGEADDEAIVPPEAYSDLRARLGSGPWDGMSDRPVEMLGQATGDPNGSGSNNWVVAGPHCRSGFPMVASDPHIAIEAVSCWYEAHLCGGDYNVAGMAYVGMPAIMFGRNERVAWGATNNICSQRDLYQERTDPAHPDCFEFNGSWEPSGSLRETIHIRDAESLERTIRFSRNGPVVDEILPPPANQTGPVTLKWLGAYHGGWLTALLAMNRAQSVADFREAVRPWHVPTFNLVVADVEGQIAMQSAGRIPLRRTAERAYRAGWDPQQQWVGLLPFEAMPHAVNPTRGWLATANNRLAGNDYPYPLFGTWISGHRAARIRHMIESTLDAKTAGQSHGFDVDRFREMQYDTVSLRAVECLGPLLDAIQDDPPPQTRAAVQLLRDWDGRIDAQSVPAAIFNVFFTCFTRSATEIRFSGAAAELLARQVDVMAARLLRGDPHGWFGKIDRVAVIRQSLADAISILHERFGEDMTQWQWGRLHQVPLIHVLAGRGDLAQLLNHGGGPIDGDMLTVCNTGSGPDWIANTGAGYRLVADLANNRLLAVEGQSQSGDPSSPHYMDQFNAWRSGAYHVLPLDPVESANSAIHRLRIGRDG